MSAIQPVNTVVDCLLWLSRELSKVRKNYEVISVFGARPIQETEC